MSAATSGPTSPGRDPGARERSDPPDDGCGAPGDLPERDVRDILKQSGISREEFLKLL
jgi:hypothetical protein